MSAGKEGASESKEICCFYILAYNTQGQFLPNFGMMKQPLSQSLNPVEQYKILHGW